MYVCVYKERERMIKMTKQCGKIPTTDKAARRVHGSSVLQPQKIANYFLKHFNAVIFIKLVILIKAASI